MEHPKTVAELLQYLHAGDETLIAAMLHDTVEDTDVTLKQLQDEKLITLRYADPVTGAPAINYPDNPNGSPDAIAGICDPSGRLFGLMPHPEAFLHRTNHPRWTREDDLPEEGQGVALFRNGVEFIRNNLL